jgi:glycosyltransferase involved in cell wall biosynthesis
MEVLPYFLPETPMAAGGGAGDAPHPRPYFLFVGRLEKIKGLDDVIPVFRDYRDADLVIAGDGEYAATLKAAAAGMANVRFLGRVAPEDLRRYYEHAVALIVPSVCFETFGIILIESFRQGTPVIARRIGPFPEIVETSGGGELFQTREELIGAMRQLQGDPERRAARARAGLAAFAARWSERAVVPQYLEIVASAARKKGDRRVLDKLAGAGIGAVSHGAVATASDR